MTGCVGSSKRVQRLESDVSEIEKEVDLGNGIMVLDNIVPLDLAEQLYLFCLDAMDEIGTPGETVSGFSPEYKITTDICLPDMVKWTDHWSLDSLRAVGYDMLDLDARMCRVVGDILRSYVDSFATLKGLDFNDTGFQMQRYRKGEGFYAEHIDGGSGPCSDRVLALVIYLNDVAVGGETFFPWQEMRVKPKAGRAVVFPTTFIHPHEALVPVSDDKYMISTFITLRQ